MQALLYVPFNLFGGRMLPHYSIYNPQVNLSGKNMYHRLRNSYRPDASKIDMSILSTVTETDSETQLESSSELTFPWAFHLLLSITTSGPLIVTVLAYKQRPAFTYMAADYVGNLGFDPRNAWISIGGLVAATGLMALLFLQRSSTSKEAFSKAPTPNLELGSVGPDFILCQTGICSMMHHVLFAATNHITPLSYITYLVSGPLFALSCVGLLLYWRRPKWRTVCKVVMMCLAILFVATTAGTQLFSDIKELLKNPTLSGKSYCLELNKFDWTRARQLWYHRSQVDDLASQMVVDL
ncbi:hypothetical protein MMC15_008668 [Xylographa vitiligo]|nr:hypothetical protein [Xylographa vitiligo]